MTKTEPPPPLVLALQELTPRVLKHLESLNYSADTLRHYEHTWRRLRAFARENEMPEVLTEELIDNFLVHCGVPATSAERKSHHRTTRRATSVLFEIALHGSVSRRMSCNAPPCVPPSLSGLQVEYLDYCARHLDVKKSTLRVRKQHLEAFLLHAHQHGVESPSTITGGHISCFIRARAHYAATTTAMTITTLRSFLRVSFAQGWIPADLSEEIPAVHVRPDATIPSVWTDAQIAQMLAEVDVASPLGKRDRAILLLACRLGIRAGDIRTLTLDALQWSAARIAFAQQKTGGASELPMTNEVAEALIDYLRHGRPKTPRREVFLRSHAPFIPFGSNNNLHSVITRYRRLAGIELPATSRRGLHSLRHTLATRLLARGTPFDTIGTILGHNSLDVTRRYTKVDLDALRSAALDLPQVTQ